MRPFRDGIPVGPPTFKKPKGMRAQTFCKDGEDSMNKVEAIIRPEKLNDVKEDLVAVGLVG